MYYLMLVGKTGAALGSLFLPTTCQVPNISPAQIEQVNLDIVLFLRARTSF